MSILITYPLANFCGKGNPKTTNSPICYKIYVQVTYIPLKQATFKIPRLKQVACFLFPINLIRFFRKPLHHRPLYLFFLSEQDQWYRLIFQE